MATFGERLAVVEVEVRTLAERLDREIRAFLDWRERRRANRLTITLFVAAQAIMILLALRNLR